MQTLHTDDGLPLHLREWPRRGDVRGSVLIVHGLGDHVGRYLRLAAELNAAGWHVAAHDQRGHGASGGARGRIPQPDALLRDLALVVDNLREHRPSPLVVLGESMGGTVAARFVAEALAERPAAWLREVDGLVMASPALDAGMTAWQKLLLAVVAPLAPDLAVSSGLRPQDLSRSPEVVADYIADPLVHDRIAGRLARFIVDAGAHVLTQAPRWRTPTLLMWAGADRCVAPRGSAAFAAAAPHGVITAHEFPQLYHEIFNDPEGPEVMGALSRWLHALPGASSALG